MKASILLILFCAALAHATIPATLNYQGVYRESGIPVSGVRTMTFRLTSADGTVEHYSSGPTSVSVSTGVFRTVLTLPASLDWGAISPYIEVSAGATVLLPRDPVSASIYAVHAATAEHVSLGAISDAAVAANAAISPGKIAGTAMTLSQTETVTGPKTFNANLLMGSGSIGAADAAGVTFTTSVFIAGAGSLALGTSIPAGPLHVRAAGTDALVVSPVSAFVGLGTSTPAERLEVKNGSIKLTGIGSGIVFADNTVLNSAAVGSANAAINPFDLLLESDSDANGSGDILFKTGATERLHVGSDGYVGVGTAAPVSHLHLALPFGHDLAFSANPGESWLVGLPSGGNTSLLNDQAVNVYAGGAGANLGGVAMNPRPDLGAALTLYGNDNPGAGSAALSASGGAGALIFKTASSERARFTSSGDLGLGTISPAARLHVSGGDLRVGDASASTFSAAGYLTMANLASPPPGAAGRFYYDAPSSKLRLNTGAGFVDIATGTASGGATVPAAGVQAGPLGPAVIASSIAVNAVVDASIVSVSGSKVTGALFLNNNSITGLADPVGNTDAVNKQWVLANAGRVQYMGQTAAVTGNMGGIFGANSICNSAFAGSRICRQSDVYLSGRTTPLPSSCWIVPEHSYQVPPAPDVFVSGVIGSFGYLSGTVCSSYTTAIGTSWGLSITVDGVLGMPVCSTNQPICCCQ